MSSFQGPGSGSSSITITGVSPIVVTEPTPGNFQILFNGNPTQTVDVIGVNSSNITNIAYNNGSSGDGATITKTSGVFTAANLGLASLPPIGSKILQRGLTTQAWRGVYDYTSPTVLTRSTDSDTTAELDGQIVWNTVTNIFYAQETSNPVIGTDPIIYDTQSTAYVIEQGTHVVNGVVVGGSAANRIKEFSNFIFDGVTATLQAALNNILQVGADYFRIGNLSNFLNSGLPGTGHYAGDTQNITGATTYAISGTVKHPSLGFLHQHGAVSPLFSSLSTFNTTGVFDIATQDLTTSDYSTFRANTTSSAFESKTGDGLHGFTYSIDNQADTAVLLHANSVLPHIKAAIYNGYTTLGFASADTPQYAGQFGGGFGLEILKPGSNYYNVDSNSAERKDSQLYTNTQALYSMQTFVMPPASENFGRIIPVTLFNPDLLAVNNGYWLEVVFNSADFTQNLLSSDYISDGVNQTRYYQSIYDDAYGYIWIQVNDNIPNGNNIIRLNSGSTMNLAKGTTDKLIVVDLFASAGTTIDLDTYDADIPVGAKVIVKDATGQATLNSIRINASGSIIYGTAPATSYNIAVDYDSVTLIKINSGRWIIV